MTRLVGSRNRSELETDPVEAYRRGRVLDAMLSGARTPLARGVFRGTHQALNQRDDERSLAAARRLNAAP